MLAPIASDPLMSLGAASAPMPVPPRTAVIRYTMTPDATIAFDSRCGARIDSELFAVAISVSVKVGA